jgi:hypothetical protein
MGLERYEANGVMTIIAIFKRFAAPRRYDASDVEYIASIDTGRSSL